MSSLSFVPFDLQGFHGQEHQAALQDLEVQGDSQLRQKQVKENFGALLSFFFFVINIFYLFSYTTSQHNIH